MTNERLFYSLTDSSLFDTYLLYGIIGLLILIALIGLIILIITSCCCFYSIPCCYHHHQRYSTYRLNEKFKEQKNTKKINFIKRQSSDVTNFSQLYNSNPYLINSKNMITTGNINKNLDASCTTLNSLMTPNSPCSSFRSFIESVPLVRNNLNYISQPNVTKGKASQSFAHLKNPTQISRRLTPCDRSISPTINTNNHCTNIYDTVIPMNPTPDRSTPIYELEWTHNYTQLMERNDISIIELPTVPQPDLVPSMDYFQQQHPYHQILANKTKTSDSMRRANMLKQIKDDTAFLY